MGDLFAGPLSPPAPSPRSPDPHFPAPLPPSIIAAQPVMCLPGAQISPAHLYYPVWAPWISAESLTSRPPGRRGSGPLRVLQRSVQAECILMLLRALTLRLLAFLLVLQQPVLAQNPRAQDVSMGVVSWGPLAPEITQTL